jgi:hypothetical protein
MKLTDILDEMMGNPEITISDLSPEQKRELYKTGRILVPLPQDPNRPEMSASQVINLPKIDNIKRTIIQNKREFDVFTFSTNPDIASTAKEISKLYNQLFRAMNALDKLMALEKQGRI